MSPIKASADDVVARAWKLDSLIKESSNKIEITLSRTSKKALKLLEQLCHTPIMTIGDVAELTETTYPPAQKLVQNFVELGILKPENETRQRNQSFCFKQYLDILEKNDLYNG